MLTVLLTRCHESSPCAALVDQPDNSRKKHVALSAHRRRGDCLWHTRVVRDTDAGARPAGAQIHPGLHIVWTLLPAAVVIFATGLLDDLAGLTAPQSCWVRLSRLSLPAWGVQIQSLRA